MKTFAQRLCLLFLLILASIGMTVEQGLSAVDPPRDDNQEYPRVGRIYYVEGSVLRYVPEERDWVAAVKDAPFGLEDALYSDENSKAELLMPNQSSVRIGGNTQLQLLRLTADVTEVDVASGIARFANKSPSAVVKVETPYGFVVAPPESSFDLYVGDQSLEVVALRGKVDFVHGRDNARYEVEAGSSSLLADGQRVGSGEGTVDAPWDKWNDNRDSHWAKRSQSGGDSVRYLPRELHDEAPDLDENGRWEQIPYEGATRTFWRPTYVREEWSPFTEGRWTDWHDDQTWIPYEPFGYVTHHYGNWVYVNRHWYWAPPLLSLGVRVGPAIEIGFHWYPGRVSWIHSPGYIGWVPLAPFEPYYCRRHWGPRVVVVEHFDVHHHYFPVHKLHHHDRPVIIKQHDFYRVNNYHNVRITNINKTTIVNNYRAAPVINHTVIKDYTKIKNRHQFTNVNVTEKPHDVVVDRIEKNRRLARQVAPQNADTIQRRVKEMHRGAPAPEAPLATPAIANKMVPPEKAFKGRSEIRFPEREIKKEGAVRPAVARQVEPARHGKGERPDLPPAPDISGKPAQLPPAQPLSSLTPGDGADRDKPTKHGRPDRSLPGQPGAAGVGGQTVQPPQPTERIKPPRSGKPERLPLGAPGQQPTAEQPGDQVVTPKRGQRERVLRGQTELPGAAGGSIQTPQPSERIKPPRPGKAERFTPVSPDRSGGEGRNMEQTERQPIRTVPEEPRGSFRGERQFDRSGSGRQPQPAAPLQRAPQPAPRLQTQEDRKPRVPKVEAQPQAAPQLQPPAAVQPAVPGNEGPKARQRQFEQPRPAVQQPQPAQPAPFSGEQPRGKHRAPQQQVQPTQQPLQTQQPVVRHRQIQPEPQGQGAQQPQQSQHVQKHKGKSKLEEQQPNQTGQ